MTPPNITPIRTEWLATRDAAERLGIHRRTLQRRARAGQIQTRTRADGAVEYRCPATVAPQGDDTVATTPHATPRATPAPQGDDTVAAGILRAELADLRASLVDAERRAAVAEYRAAQVVSDLERVTAERDAARDRVRELRTGTLARLARRVAELTQGG